MSEQPSEEIGQRTHYRTCNLCEAMCGLVVEVAGDRVVSIKGDADDPFSRGHICPKAVALQDIYQDPDRLRQPVRRTAVGWEPITWDEAFDEVVARLKAVQAAHGRNAIGVYQGNPNVHNLGSMLYSPPFIRALRTRSRFSATSVDQLPHHMAAYHMFGHQLLIPIPDVDRTDFFLMVGANPLASNGSLMTAAGIDRRLKEMQARGGKLVVVDPRRTETAVLANTHLFIRPGTDALLLLALLHTIFADGLANPGRLAAFTDGLAALAELAAPFAPEMAAAATGIPAAQIRQLAHDFCAAETAVAYGRIGASTQAFGGLTHWLINALNVVTGNLDRPGGAMFTLPAFDIVGLTGMTGSVGSYGRWRSRVRGLPEFAGELPVAALAEEILAPGEGQIRALVVNAGNPVLSTPNGRQLDEALAGLEFMVAVDIYINETTRHAHIILPPTTGLETEHYDLVFHAFAVRNTAKYSPALFTQSADARADWQIFRELRNRWEGVAQADRRTVLGKLDFFRRLPPDKLVDLALRFGPYGSWGGRRRPGGLSLRQLKRNPHGIDLGPLQSCLPQRLYTANKRINLTPEPLAADVDRLKTAVAEMEMENGRALLLIGRRQLRSNNSWMHNSPRLVKGKNRCTLLLHPDDAAARQIVDGQTVRLRSRVGQVDVAVELTNDMMPGVVSLPHGWGHGREGVRLATAVTHPGVSLNDLTDDQAIDALTGNAAFSGLPVMVEPI